MSHEDKLNDLMDSIKDQEVRRDLVYTLIAKAYALGFDDGFNEGCEAVRHEPEVWARD
jgi:flagellar biosynthesis/type III secretory pathway protein FliH